MMRLFNKIILAVLCCAPAIVYSQSDSTARKFSFKIGTYYNSNLHYYGRTDSLKSSGIFPMAELWFREKFYVNVAPVFTFNKVNAFQYAGSVATAGYVYNNGKSAAHIYMVKPIYKDNSQLVQSALKAQAAANFSWLNKILNLTGGVDIKFSDGTDYGVTAGLDHLFRKELRNSILVIDPSAYIYAGTQKFTKTRIEKTGFELFPGPDQVITEETKKFSILSYELSMPVIYKKDNWMLLVTPSYVIPQNLITVENRPELSERGNEMFYITAGARISF